MEASSERFNALVCVTIVRAAYKICVSQNLIESLKYLYAFMPQGDHDDLGSLNLNTGVLPRSLSFAEFPVQESFVAPPPSPCAKPPFLTAYFSFQSGPVVMKNYNSKGIHYGILDWSLSLMSVIDRESLFLVNDALTNCVLRKKLN